MAGSAEIQRGVSFLNHTSKRCSRCGFTHKDNRNGGSFACLSCGYELHADYNAVAELRPAGSKVA